MRRRALLIGAQTFGLTGVDHDVRTVRQALGGWGFDDIRVCWRSDATRDGILDAYERLIADATDEDPVLVYYSGHGGIASPLPGDPVEVARTDRQFIVPTDFGADGFRGITAIELSVLLARLTRRTANAVVVLDCCHSAMMSRNLGDLRVRQLPPVQRVDLAAHLRRQVDAGLRVDLAAARGNPHAVRLAACGVDQFAYERRSQAASGACGLLTDALVVALGEAAGIRVSWSRLVARVRYLVERRTPHQRPEAEGPAERVLFDTRTDDEPGSLPVAAEGPYRARLDGAGLFGVQVDDDFVVTSTKEGSGSVATVRITAAGPVTATGQLTYTDGRPPLPPDARAHRTKATAPRVPVRVPPELDLRGALFVRPAGPGEEAPFSVVVADGTAVVRDAIGPLHPPRPLGPEFVENLERAARATTLLSIREHTGWSSATLAAATTVEWGRVVDGRAHPLPNGSAVDAGDRLYIGVDNTGDTEVRLSLIDVGLTYAITVLTDFAPSGVPLPPGGRYVFGGEEGLEGVELEWPDGLDPTAARPETVLVLVTSDPHDITAVEQRAIRSLVTPDPLSELLSHLGAGRTRDLRRRPAPGTFLARSVEFTVVPAGLV